jgi:hypothetical protein
MPNAMGQVNPEHGDCRAANSGAANQDRPVLAEMTSPSVAARIEEPCALASFGIDTCKVGPFMMVVSKASQGEITGNRLAPVLLRDDVIDFEGKFVVDLRHAAEFTTLDSALPDELSQDDIHARSGAPLGTPEHLPSFRLENRKNRADAFELIHFGIFFRGKCW